MKDGCEQIGPNIDINAHIGYKSNVFKD